MKLFITSFIFLILFLSKTYSNITDFQIEGISIGDKLTDHYDEWQQKNFNSTKVNKGLEEIITFTDSNFKVFDQLQILYYTDSKVIKQISGILEVPILSSVGDGNQWVTKFEACKAKQDKITKEISKLSKFKPKYNDENISDDGSRSLSNDIVLSNDGFAKILCIDTENNNDPSDPVYLFVTVSKGSEKFIASLKKRNIENVESIILDDKNKKKFVNKDKTYALLIANSDYDYWEDLNSPYNDINAISSILKNDYGFEVEILNDADRNTILDKLFEYSGKTTDKDNMLIYYAGHGDIINNNAYWIPKNATKNISSNWLNVNDVNSAISLIKAKDLLVMVDACYQGTAFKSGNKNIIGPSEQTINDEKYYYKMLNIRSAVVITSGNDEAVIDEVVNGHSAFAYKFIEILKNNKNYETSTSMFVKIKKYHANLNQNPNLIRMAVWGDLGGDFIFLKN